MYCLTPDQLCENRPLLGRGQNDSPTCPHTLLESFNLDFFFEMLPSSGVNEATSLQPAHWMEGCNLVALAPQALHNVSLTVIQAILTY